MPDAMNKRKTNRDDVDTWTAEERAFASRVEQMAHTEGRISATDVRAAVRLRRAAVRAFRWNQENESRTRACRSGGSNALQFRAFEEQFRPEVDRAVGSMVLGLLPFLLSLFFAGLRQWLVSTVLRLIWNGAMGTAAN